ncbi:unnamed protein product [Caenorhabditis auriculariae]|uniref:Methyltransferase type 11 domain-containing protein n=1 Tax=Caenorhabditis auriculariae TaxID=2777116 RepID=A0A8S1GPQ8_9PELO|nr:unnamed protein product [Caenorhabditis auriculariae]
MESNLQYARKEYWDERFQKETEFEWLTGLKSFAHIVVPELSSESRIAHIGCGSSKMSKELFDLGYQNITNVDYSQTLINNGKERYPAMDWTLDDITSLSTLDDESFDVVLEKATLEAVLVGEQSPWDPSDEALKTLDNIFSSVCRVLKPGGKFISISFTQPHFRLPALLRESRWAVDFRQFGDSFHYFVYICKKGAQQRPQIVSQYGNTAPGWSRTL